MAGSPVGSGGRTLGATARVADLARLVVGVVELVVHGDHRAASGEDSWRTSRTDSRAARSWNQITTMNAA